MITTLFKYNKTLLKHFFRKFNIFFRLSNPKKKLFIEAYFYLVIAFLFIRITSFRSYQLLFNQKYIDKNPSSPHKVNSSKRGIHSVIKTAARYVPWESKCYDQAISAKIMLNKRNINNTLYIGTCMEDNDYIFHAWVSSQDYIVTGRGELEKFTIIAQFSSKIKEK